MGLPVSLIGNLNFNCTGWFSGRKTKQNKEVMESLYRVSQKYKLSILPISSTYDLENLYPITDRVREWNTFVIGNDKTYILSRVGDKTTHLNKEQVENIVDTKGAMLPEELFLFFDSVWDHTLKGNQLQFYIVLNGQLYLINTYCLRNRVNNVIGAILFMRNFDTLPQSYSTMNDDILARAESNVLKATNTSLVNALQATVQKP